MVKRLKLNEKTLRRAEPKPGVSYQIFDTEVIGFAARVQASGVAVFGGVAYLACGSIYHADRSSVMAIDVTDPAEPTLITSLETSNIPTDAAVMDDSYVFVAENGSCSRVAGEGVECSGAVLVLDVSNPSHPAELALYETEVVARQLAVADGYVYVAQEFCDMDIG